jgi:hypothetical protein
MGRPSYLLFAVHINRALLPQFVEHKQTSGAVVVADYAHFQGVVHAVHVEDVNMW